MITARGENAGCGAIAGIIMALILGATVIILAIFALANLADSRANQTHAQAALEFERGRAQAIVIQAQGQARLDAAQAAAISSAAMLPWGALAILGLLGLAVVALCMVIVARPKPHRPEPPTRIIERHVVYLPTPGQSRRETWQQVAALQNVIEMVEVER